MIRILILLVLFSCSKTSFTQRPSLTLTKAGIEKIKADLDSAPLFKKQLELVQKEIDTNIAKGIDVPIPKDMAGGYTHQQHKLNYKLMYKAGNLYQFTGDEKYAAFVKEMMMEYADMYPKIPIHPTQRSYATGKIFWQCLNDANWLVFTSQAYDCIYEYLSKEERQHLEKDLFVPFADFLSIDNPKFFNRIHNHSTWANAAVGLMALAMNNDTLLQKALYGLENDGIDPNEVDNDGGYIKKDGTRQAGFLAQLDYSFSPEGYFSEGPYYQRYAIFPFLVFSHAIHNKRPDLKIFEYRESILKKATNTMLELTDPNGQFFPINDSQKGMSYKAFEIITAVDLMYMLDNSQDDLLAWAELQDEVAFNEAGFIVAQKLAETNTTPPVKQSKVYGDGINGNKGGIAVLRLGESELLFKFSSHGMGHGHFDRLSYSFYDKSGEVLQDYGAVRWVNVDQKAGGRYLPENNSFGKQTIAHNTLVINQASQYSASVKKSEKTYPTLYCFDNTNPQTKIVSAIEEKAYSGVHQQRVLILHADEEFDEPIMIDFFICNSDNEVTYNLPLWFKGHHMQSNFDCSKNLSEMKPIGDAYGYQHIWQESVCPTEGDNYKFNWFGNERFYTVTGINEDGDNIIMGRAGANDPNYNLRPDPVMIHERKSSGHSIFYNIIESHGRYNRTTEIPKDPYAQIESVNIIHSEENYVIANFSNDNSTWEICLSTNDNNPESNHEVSVGKSLYEWHGIYNIKKIKN
jgi:hypothetical protein